MALKGLLCSLLYLNSEDISEIQILNPIAVGQSIEDKEYRLDILVLLNQVQRINIELQIINFQDWPNRSLVYLCRQFDQVSR